MKRTAFSLNEINGSEAHGEEKKAEPKDAAVDRGAKALSPLPRPGSDGSLVGDEPDEARQAGQS